MPDETYTINQSHHRAAWAHRLAIALVIFGAILNLFYLFHNSQLNLSEDESHYWEWSRHLDYGYYSKPPGIAWVIAAATKFGELTHLNGDNSGTALMPIVRLPAVLFGLLSGLLTLSLARRIFKDDRAALAAILLSAAVPMFTLGSLLITIDSPMYLCWAATVYCLWRFLEPGPQTTDHGPRTLWLYLAAFACAAGMLFKPVLIAIPLSAVVAMCVDPYMRRRLLSFHSIVALLIVLASQIPVVLWNANHNWVMFAHISTQGFSAGASQQNKFIAALSHLGEYVGGQAGGMGGLLFILLVIAVILAIKQAKHAPTDKTPWTFLLAFTLPLWLFYFLINFWKNTEINWPAASYFTGMILLAGIFTQGYNAIHLPTQKWWRTWGTITILWGVTLSTIALNLHRFYPLAASHLPQDASNLQYHRSPWFPTHWDPALRKLRGFDLRANAVQTVYESFAKETHQTPLLIADRYGTASSLSFYLPSHPFCYCVMSSIGGRKNQYDIWPTLDEKSPTPPNGSLKNAGLPALIVGTNPDDTTALRAFLTPAFDRIEGPEFLPLYYQGILITQVPVFRAYNFKGLPAPTTSGGY